MSCGDSSILLDVGIGIKEIQKALQFRLSEIEAVCITHEHQDHTKAVRDILRMGITCYMTEGTKEALGLEHHRIEVIEARKQFQIGKWRILPFDVEHDAKEPVGYLIEADGEKCLFATDTYYIRYKFKGISILAVECNYSEKLLEENILKGKAPLMLRNRLRESHFSLEHYLDFLRANDLSKVREIWVLHMSNQNSNEELFKKRIQEVTGKPVYIA